MSDRNIETAGGGQETPSRRELVALGRSSQSRIVRTRKPTGEVVYSLEYETVTGAWRSSPLTLYTDKDVRVYMGSAQRYPTAEEVEQWNRQPENR